MPLNAAARASSIATRKAQAVAHAAATLKLIQDARAAGAKTNVAICKYLNAIGSRTSWKCAWTAQTVGQLINHKAKKITEP